MIYKHSYKDKLPEPKLPTCDICNKWYWYFTNKFGKKLCPACAATYEPSIITSNWNIAISPSNFEEYVGQNTTKQELQTMLKAQKIHHLNVPHCLFGGEFGLGKTTLAKIFASYIEDYVLINSNEIDFSNFPKAKVVILDEIQSLKNSSQLLTIMDTSEQIILGCTTTVGSLSAPLRSRFIHFNLDPYSVTDLIKMLENLSTRLKIDVPKFILQEISKRSKENARLSTLLFRRMYDNYIVYKGWNIKKFFEDSGIDSNGLDNIDKKYLAALNKITPIGIQQLSAVTGIDKITILEIVEPFLLRHNYVSRTPKGRLLCQI